MKKRKSIEDLLFSVADYMSFTGEKVDLSTEELSENELDFIVAAAAADTKKIESSLDDDKK